MRIFKSFLVIGLSFLFLGLKAQTGLNFQGVARNNNNVVLASQQISLRLSILQGSSSGTTEYREIRVVNTNAQGLFNVVIGDTGAISTLGNFNTINWKLMPKYLQIEMDPAGGNNFITMGTTQFQSVGYAMYSNGVDANNISGLVPVARGGTGTSSLSELKIAMQLDKLNNTSDAEKPISNATSVVLNEKLNISDSTLKYVTPSQLLAQKFDPSTINNSLLLKANTNDVTNALVLKANIESPTFTGIVSGITKGMVGLENVDNTADISKPISAATQVQLDNKENIANKSTDTRLGTSDELYPTQNAVKTYVDGVASTGTPDATTSSKGKIVLAGDLTGTAENPTIASNKITTEKLANQSVTDAKIVGLSGSKVTGDISGSAANVTGTVLLNNGGTGASTATEARANLGLVIGTNVLAQRTFGTAADKNVADFEAPLSFTTPLSRTSNTISIPVASASVNGYLSGADWTSFNSKVNSSEKGANSGVATLGVDGKIPSTQIPAISFQSANVVSSEAEMLALSNAVEGSIAIRTDINENFVLSVVPATNTNNWIRLRTPVSVSTVNGLVGPNISLTTTQIPEGDNKYFTNTAARNAIGVSGPLSYDAATGLVSIPVATTNQNGYLSATDWNNFNNKQTAFGTQSTNTFFAAPANADGVAIFRAITPSDIPTLNQNTTGNAATATKLATAKKINGVDFDGTADINITASGAAVVTSATTSLADPFDFNWEGANLSSSPLNISTAENIANGPDALATNTTGIANTAIGVRTLRSNTTGVANSAVGFESLYSNTTGRWNTAMGTYALRSNTTGDANTALGSTALLMNTTGIGNSAIGEWSMRANTTGSWNTGMGLNTLFKNTTGLSNAALGASALFNNTTGNNNVGAGAYSLRDNTTGNFNAALGSAALLSNTIGAANTAVGTNSLRFNLTGNFNTAVGAGSMLNNLGGQQNTVVGESALNKNTTGNSNTALGQNAMSINTTGSFNTALGFNAGVASNALTNTTAIGASALVAASNTIQLGNAAVTNVNTSAAVNAKLFVKIGGTATQFLKADGSVDANTYLTMNEKATANGVATLDATGKIPSNQIPAISFQSAKVVADEASMLSLSAAVEGSIAIRTDNNKSYVLSTLPANLINNWIEIRTPGSVTSVNGQQGPSVVLTTDQITEGINNKYFSKELTRTAFSSEGPLLYDPNNGQFTIQTASSNNGGYLSATDWNNFNNKQTALTAGTGITVIDNVASIGQDVSTTSTPNFAQVIAGGFKTVSGTSSEFLKADGSVDANTYLTISNLNAVDTTTNQNIGGVKTFKSDIIVQGISVGKGGGSIITNTALGLNALHGNTTGYSNTAIGAGTLQLNTGYENTAVGEGSLSANTSGYQNTALGHLSLNKNTTGKYNVAIGRRALNENVGANGSVAIGYSAMRYANNTVATINSNNNAIGYMAMLGSQIAENNTGVDNNALGAKALYNNTSGSENIAVGTNALYNNTSGVRNIGIGPGSLQSNTTGSNNLGIGVGVLFSNTLGTWNAAVGTNSMVFNTEGYQNAAFGDASLQNNTIGYYNAGLGSQALMKNTQGRSNAAVGAYSLWTNKTGNYNTALGFGADVLYDSLINATAIGAEAKVSTINTIQLGNTNITDVKTSGTVTANAYKTPTGTSSQFLKADGTIDNTTYLATTNLNAVDTTTDQNIAGKKSFLLDMKLNGLNAGRGLGNDSSNTVFGIFALDSNTTGRYNTAVGNGALRANKTGIDNVAFGSGTLYFNTIGNYNTTSGGLSLHYNIEGNNNNAYGFTSLLRNTYGSGNTGYGTATLYNNTIGNNNIAFGYRAAFFNISGSYNTALGDSALLKNTYGSYNVAVGKDALKDNMTGYYNTAIGTRAGVTSSALFNSTALGYEAKVNASNTIQLGNIYVTDVKTSGTITAAGYKTVSGTSSQFLKADGTIDNSVYLTSSTIGNSFMDLTTAQTVAGEKSFTNDIIHFGLSSRGSATTSLSFPHTDDPAYIMHSSAGNNGKLSFSAGDDDGSNQDYFAFGYGSPLAFTEKVKIYADGKIVSPVDANINNLTIGLGGGQLSSNIAFGNSALAVNTTGSSNIGIGNYSLSTNNSGESNTAVGSGAMSRNTVGSNNTGIGNGVLYNNYDGQNNTALGSGAMVYNIGGGDNTGVGRLALANNSNGFNNVAVGSEALSTNLTGSGNTAIGYKTAVNSNNLTNATAIGSNARVDCSDCLVLGSVNGVNSASTTTRVGIGTTNPNASAALEVSSTTKGFLPPRITIQQRNAITSPVAGLVVYCTDCEELQVYNGTLWKNMMGAAACTEAVPPTIAIGSQTWMLKNLDVSTYRNGDNIPQVTVAGLASATEGAWCYYNDDPTTAATYGKLYNWYAVNDPRGIAPYGWHVPSETEFVNLANALGGNLVAGGKMKEAGTAHWINNYGGTNTSGFTGLPAGWTNGSSNLMGAEMDFWTTTTVTTTTAKHSYTATGNATAINTSLKTNGFSVRCIRD